MYHYLNHLPEGLDAIYGEIWTRATGTRDSRQSYRVRMLLLWVLIAEQPLSATALAEALVASEGSKSGSCPLSEHEIVSLCAGLVTIDTFLIGLDASSGDHVTQSVATLSHSSVQQYLEKNRAEYFPNAHDTIVDVCLSRFRWHELHEALSFVPKSAVYDWLSLSSCLCTSADHDLVFLHLISASGLAATSGEFPHCGHVWDCQRASYKLFSSMIASL